MKHSVTLISGALLCGLAATALGGCSSPDGTSRQNERSEVTTESIPFAMEGKNDPSLAEGAKKVVQKGKDGVREITWRLSGGGANARRERVSERVVEEPLSRVVAVGTQVPASRRKVVVRGAVVTVTDVQRGPGSDKGAKGADTLYVTYHVDNTNGTQAFAANRDLQVGLAFNYHPKVGDGNSKLGESNYRRWRSEGADQTIPIGRYGDIRLHYMLSVPGSVRPLRFAQPSQFHLVFFDSSGRILPGSAPLNAFWRETLPPE